MKEFTETEIKYLAGLLDADGYACLDFNKGYITFILGLELSESCDRDGRFIKSLSEKVGSLSSREREGWSKQNSWTVKKRADVEKLLPRILKHMVIKAKHWNKLLDIFREYKANRISYETWLSLQETLKEREYGPLKLKKHPTWAWACGYIEGDGWFLTRDRGKYVEMHVGVVSHSDAQVGISLLHKAFGGIIKTDNKGYIRWIKNLGVQDHSFVVRFLPKLIQHSQLKKHKMEKILSIHSQRLNVSTPKGEVIV